MELYSSKLVEKTDAMYLSFLQKAQKRKFPNKK